MNKLTKIVATIGPASDTEDKISKLIDLGVNVFRFNLKHNELSWHRERIDLVKKVAADKDTAVGVMIDLQGPEIRAIAADAGFEVMTGEDIMLKKELGAGKTFTISHPDVLQYFEVGQQVVVDDGRLEFKVKKAGKEEVVLEAIQDGVFKTRKTLNLPGATYPMPCLTQKDRDAVIMAKECEVDFIALSFVRTADDVAELKEFMAEQKVTARVISKVEAKVAIDNLDDIVAASEGIMVARGDLAIEVPREKVPYYQKLMIKKCMERGIPVITATQMLHSMAENPYPTRAEVSDVANAAYDFTDSVMLSEETAMGKHPERTVEVMSNTVKFSEMQDIVHDTRTIFNYYILDTEEMLCATAYNLYLRFKEQGDEFGGFIVFSQSGRTGRKLSRYRPKAPIFVMAPNKRVRDGLTMSYGVTPFIQPKTFENVQVRIEDMKEAFDHLKERDLIDPAKYYILLYGDNWGVEGGVSTIKVIKMPRGK